MPRTHDADFIVPSRNLFHGKASFGFEINAINVTGSFDFTLLHNNIVTSERLYESVFACLLEASIFMLLLSQDANYNPGQKSLRQWEHNCNSMCITSNVVKSSAVILQIHNPSLYNWRPNTFVHDCSFFLAPSAGQFYMFFFSYHYVRSCHSSNSGAQRGEADSDGSVKETKRNSKPFSSSVKPRSQGTNRKQT